MKGHTDVGYIKAPAKNAKRLTREQMQAGWEIVTCPTCNGSGKRGDRTCGLCEGRRRVVAKR